MAETCHEENGTQLIRDVEVTPSISIDTDVIVPATIDGLAERKVRPDELFIDTFFVWNPAAMILSKPRTGYTELAEPRWKRSSPGNSHEGEGDGPPPLTGKAEIYRSNVTAAQATVFCAGHPSIEEYKLKDAPERVDDPLCRDNMRALPLAKALPSEAGPSFG